MEFLDLLHLLFGESKCERIQYPQIKYFSPSTLLKTELLPRYF